MRTNYVLVDYENVQPKDFGLLKSGPFRVRLFLGPNQSKVPVSLAAALQVLGGDAEYVPLEASGTNALNARFNKQLTESQLSALFASLCGRGLVQLDGSKITYTLPS